MKLIRERVQQKIAVIEAQMAERRVQITGLEAANTADEAQITDLRAKETAVEKALEAIADLDPILLTGPVETGKAKRVMGLRKLVLEMVEKAGLSGLSTNEIINHAKDRRGLDVKVGSLKSVLYKAQQDGVLEQTPGGKNWRFPPDTRQLAPSDAARVGLRH